MVEAYDMQYQGRERVSIILLQTMAADSSKLFIKEWETYKAIIDDIIKGGITND